MIQIFGVRYGVPMFTTIHSLLWDANFLSGKCDKLIHTRGGSGPQQRSTVAWGHAVTGRKGDQAPTLSPVV
jgi:hypothetical protein